MKTDFKDLKTQRVYINRYINRYYNGNRNCVLCNSSNTTIVHNPSNPYKVSFICRECAKSADKAKLPKIDVTQHITNNRYYSKIKYSTLDKIARDLVKDSLKTTLSMTEFLRIHKVSYRRFQKFLDLYEEIDKDIKTKVKIHYKNNRCKNK